MKAIVTYTEEWERKVEVTINEEEIRAWIGGAEVGGDRFDGEIIGKHVVEFLDASREDREWLPMGAPNAHDDEFVNLSIDHADILPVVKDA